MQEVYLNTKLLKKTIMFEIIKIMNYINYIKKIKFMKLSTNWKKIILIAITTICGLGLSHASSPQTLTVINSTGKYTVSISTIDVYYGTNPNPYKDPANAFKNIIPNSKSSDEWPNGWLSWLSSFVAQNKPLKLKVVLVKDDEKVYDKEITFPFNVINQAGDLPILNDVNLHYAASNPRPGGATNKYTYTNWTLTFTEKAQK